ncbi:MAG: SDR family oxidoreductase [Alphaproteobacteria bacterium]
MDQPRTIPVPELAGKTAFVTGASRGIGIEVVAELLRAGATVFASSYVDEPLPAWVRALGDGARLFELRCDVTCQDQVDAAFEAVMGERSHLDILINNAGVMKPIGGLAQIDVEEWTHCIDVNINGVMRCTRKALPLLVESKGVIVNASSGAARRALEGWSAYCTSKAGLSMLSRATAHEYGSQGVKVFALGIGPTDTGMQAVVRASGINPVADIPQTDLTHPRVPASVMVWLCGADARAIEEVDIDLREDRFQALMTVGIAL